MGATIAHCGIDATLTSASFGHGALSAERFSALNTRAIRRLRRSSDVTAKIIGLGCGKEGRSFIGMMTVEGFSSAEQMPVIKPEIWGMTFGVALILESDLIAELQGK
jgi:hypothetical protein